MIEDQDNTSKASRLSYLAETLADALQDMEAARVNRNLPFRIVLQHRKTLYQAV